MALARLGMSVDEFLDITPLELDIALREDMQYRFAMDKQLMALVRYVGVIVRNKGLKTVDQIRDVQRFYPFWWELQDKPEVEILTDEDWHRLDRKYCQKPAAN